MNKLSHHVAIDPNKKQNLRNMTNTKNLLTIKSSNSKSMSVHVSTTRSQNPAISLAPLSLLQLPSHTAPECGSWDLVPWTTVRSTHGQDAAMFSWILFQFMIPNVFRNKMMRYWGKKLQEEEAMIWDILWTSMNQENKWKEEKTIVYDWGWKPLTLSSERVNRFNMRSYYQLVDHTIQRQSWHQGNILQKVFLCCCLDYVPEAKSLASKMRDHFE